MPQYSLYLFIIFSLITCIQLFYYWFFFSRLAFYKPKKHEINQKIPVSVIICAKDEEVNLKQNLPEILNQNYTENFEVIVVDDNSTDNTKYILTELEKKYNILHSTILKQEAQFIKGKKFPLSIGIRTAHNENLLLTDADCVPASKQWLQLMINGFTQNKQIVLGYGAYEKNKSLLNKLIRFETFHTAIQYLSYTIAGIPYMGVGRNLAYQKTLFLKSNGFSKMNQILGGDDDLLINKIANKNNTSIVIDKNAFTISIPKKTWKSWYAQKSRHYSTSIYYKPIHKFLLGLYASSHFLFYVFFMLCLYYCQIKLTIIIFSFRFLTQGVIWFFAMKKLNEFDIWKYFILFDIWSFIYYIIFAKSVIEKPKSVWN